ncbi:WD domain, G-beta repeat family protein [Leishmania donovani]|uniref:WD domain, G-beta repeat family protein n=1 Tax=Leishmania donovani TaxID=5661 RepID=A0A504WYT5_LEIDO|nr:WD domain, G-beta repeat family protein [Leishmania donovani]
MSQNPRMIERRVVFGVREDVKDGVHYLGEDYVVWVAGESLVLLDTQQGTQELVQCTPGCEGVTAMAVAPSRRLLAVAESGKTPFIVIYLFDSTASPRIRRRSVLHLSDLGSTEFVSLSFSQDGRYLVALGGFPEWKLVYWDVEKHKMLAHDTALESAITAKDSRHLKQCSISPYDASLVCVTGQGCVKFFSYTDGHLFPTIGGVEAPDVHYLAHTWLIEEESRLVVSTDNGDLLLFEKQQYKHPLPLSPSDGIAITALASYTKGFVCGGDMGLITLFERTLSKEMYRKVRTFRFAADGRYGAVTDLTTASKIGAQVPVIRAFTFTPPPAEEMLAFLTSTKQIYSLNVPNADFTKAEDMVFQPVGQPFHTGGVVAVDTCVQRPLVATAGRDGSVFLWNSITNVVEMRNNFQEEIVSMAMHPSGLHMIIAFTDSMRVFNIYEKELCEFKRLSIRNCAACRFSHGGQYFAIANSTIIHVHYAYTCELLGHLRGHNSKVRSLSFVPPDDTRLISSGADGAVFEFSLCDFHKVRDNVTKAVTYHCAAADVHTVWAAGNDRKMRQMDRSTMLQTIEYNLPGASMRCMLVSQSLKLLFGGCEDGTVRVFNTYLGEKLNGQGVDRGGGGVGGGGDGHHGNPRIVMAQRDITIESHVTHIGIITDMALSYDEGMLITVGEDGMVVFWDVVAPHRGTVKQIEHTTELLVDRRDLDASMQLLHNLTTQVKDLQQRMAQQKLKKERQHEEQIAQLDRDYQSEMQKQKAEIAALQAAKGEQAIRFTEFMAEMEQKFAQTLSQTEKDYRCKIESLSSRADQLRHLLAEADTNHEREKALLQGEADTQRVADKQRQQRELHALDEEQYRIAAEKERNDAETEAMCAMIEEDNDTEIVKAKEYYEKRLREQEEEAAALQSANNALLSKLNMSRAELESKMADVTEKLRQQTVLESHINSAKRDIEALTNELKLEHMEAETSQYESSNEHLVLQIKSLRQKRAAQQKELDGLAARIAEAKSLQGRMWAEISDTYNEYQASKDKKRLKSMAKALYENYTDGRRPANQRQFTSARTATDEVKDYHRERDHLEGNLASLKRKIAKDEENHRVEKHRITTENVILIKEINDLRKEARTLAAKAGVVRPTDPNGVSVYDEQYAREVSVQQAEMVRLRAIVEQLEAQLKAKGLPLPVTDA